MMSVVNHQIMLDQNAVKSSAFSSFFSFFLFIFFTVFNCNEILPKLCAAVKMSVKEMGQATFH